MIWKFFVCFLFGLSLRKVLCQDVFGCGGFVQSTVPIKFEKVEVKLYTKQGSFKSKTECTPNNGYFLVAIYDKGDYVLKINPPEGWQFSPQEIELKVDGVNDPCSKGEDLNFVFSGFTVAGMIHSFGKDVGPSSVTVTLETKDGIVSETITSENGNYVFTNVMPGDYKVKAAHPTWALKNNDLVLKVVDDNVHIEKKIIVAGYDVKGHVLSSGEPIEGVKFALFSSDIAKKDVMNCEDIPKEILSTIKLDTPEQPLCITASQKDGIFLFQSLPTGSYVLVPYYTMGKITFDIVPSKLAFSVNLKSVIMKTPFQLYGFSVGGKVLNTKGAGIEGVSMTVISESGEKKNVLTSANGEYLLENVTTGHYTFKMSKEHHFFKDEKIHISPNTATMKDILVSEYRLCGVIQIQQMPAGMRQLQQVKVLLQPEGQQNTNIKTTAADKDGRFCFQTTPGKYKVEVPVIESEVKLGFLLNPSHLLVEVVDKPLLDLKFQQFLATVSGTVQCIGECKDVAVYLMSLEKSSTEKIFGNSEGSGGVLNFNIPNVLPGNYKVTPQRKKWCWNPQHIEVQIKDTDVKDLKLHHSGYYLKCLISHNITLNFALENSKEEVGTFELKKGENQFCLKTPGVYELSPKSCYKFEQEMYTYNTAEPKTLSLDVAFYKVVITINTAGISLSDLQVEMKSLTTGKTELLNPKQTDGQKTTYEATMWGRLSEEIIVTPISKQVLFTPKDKTVIVTESCPGAHATFEGHQGIFIEGRIKPPFAGVVVKVTSKQLDQEHATEHELFTDKNGAYRLGPMHQDTIYEVTASKDGYHISPQPNMKGSFIAQKLGHISVTVADEEGRGMGNVFVSLSGTQYRNNNLTKEDGTFLFPNLSPGQYFLRPMQKEYSFDPATKMIDVTEGEDVVINIQGKRVAFSCSGTIASLAGVSGEKIGVEAVGLHKCSEYHETAVSDGGGNFRLRGLQPGCSYNVKLIKSNDQVNEGIERLAPESHVVQVQTDDISDINFLVFMKPERFSLTAQIDTDIKFLNTLKVLLYDEDNTDAPVQVVNLNVLKYIQFPPLPPKNYVLKLTSSLSSRTHDVITTTATVKSEGDLQKKHVKLKFEAKEKKVDVEPTQSVIALPFAVAFIFLAYNYDAVIAFLVKLNVFVQTFNNNKADGGEKEHDGFEDIGITTYNKMMKKKRR